MIDRETLINAVEAAEAQHRRAHIVIESLAIYVGLVVFGAVAVLAVVGTVIQ